MNTMSPTRKQWKLLDEIFSYRATESINKYIQEIGINYTDQNNSTLLHELCSRGTPELVAYAISKGAKLDVMDKDGYTPLALACSTIHQRTALLLIEAGADVNLGKNNFPLTQAVYGYGSRRSTKVIQALLDRGASMDARSSISEFTAGQFAELFGYDEVVSLLEKTRIEAILLKNPVKPAVKKTKI